MKLGFWKSYLLLRAFVSLIRHPRDLEFVYAIVDQISDPDTMQPIVDAFAAHPRGARAFQTRPRVGHVDLPKLRALPDGTLGREFARFCDAEGIDPNELPRTEPTDIYSYTNTHMYEAHDIWHVVTGFHTDIAGELGLQAFYYAQFPSKFAGLVIPAGMLNTLLYAWEEKETRMDAIVRGWQLGKSSDLLFGYDWAANWHVPLSEIRRELGVSEALLAA